MKDDEKTREQLLADVKMLRWMVEDAKNAAAEKRESESGEEGGDPFFALNPEPALIADRQGTILAANEAFQAAFGRDDAELAGSSAMDLFPPPAAARRRAGIEEALFTGRPVRFQDDCLERSWETSIHPLPGKDGAPSKAILFSTDITEKKNLEIALDEAQWKYRRTYETVSEGIFQSAPDGHFVSVNNPLARMFGYASPDDFIRSVGGVAGQHFVDPSRLTEFLKLLKEDGAVYNYETQMARKDQSVIWVSLNARAIRDKSKVLYYEGTVIDMTRQKRLESELAHSRKTESAGRLAGGIAHNFSNLLTVMAGTFELFRQKASAGEPIHREAQEMEDAITQGSKLCEQLLGLSRRQLTRPVETDLGEVVSGMAEMLRYLLGENIVSTISSEPGIRKVRVDPSFVEQIILILAENARDAMKKGGSLAITVRNTDLTGKERETVGMGADTPPGPCVALTVRDTGKGIPTKMLAHIFDPFFTLKPDGTGLGLSIVHSIVRQCGAHITAESEPGKGTAFTVYFPVFEGVEQGEEKMPFYYGEPVPEPNATIMVVEDESGILYWVTDVLEGLGYRVLSAFSAEEAITGLEKAGGSLDLLISDLVLPGISGEDLAATLKDTYPEMKTIFMSGYLTDGLQKSEVIKNTPFLSKPFTPLLLLMKVKEAMGN